VTLASGVSKFKVKYTFENTPTLCTTPTLQFSLFASFTISLPPSYSKISTPFSLYPPSKVCLPFSVFTAFSHFSTYLQSHDHHLLGQKGCSNIFKGLHSHRHASHGSHCRAEASLQGLLPPDLEIYLPIGSVTTTIFQTNKNNFPTADSTDC